MTKTLSYSKYLDKVYGCLLGKTVIGTLGAPFEGIKMPMELEFKPEMINTMLPNDDLDLQILWLDAVEKHGRDFTSKDLLERFIARCPYDPGEYATMRKNGKRGIWPPLSGSFSNEFYLQGMGCPIRSEIWACLFPLNPMEAADFSVRDGVLDHAGESVYAERFFAALESAAFFECDLYRLIEIGLCAVPADARIRTLIEDTLALCDCYDDPKLIFRKILFRYGHLDCTNLFQNVAITLFSLLKGEGDLIKTGMIALNSGFDTDCTCATAGAILGLISGARTLESRYGWRDIRYVLGVDLERRSDKVDDLAEDVALLGAHLNAPAITDAPETHFAFAPSEFPLTFSVSYENDDPTFFPDKPCHLTLTVTNRSKAKIETVLAVRGVGVDLSLKLSLGSKEALSLPITAECPDERVISDTNRIVASYSHGGVTKDFAFGVVGAMPWKAIGPIWRTDPVCTTALLLEHDLNYWKIVDAVPYEGERMDVTRRFHLNCAVDTDTEYMTFDECFAPYDPEADTKYEETVFYQKKDAFTFSDLCGFRGPSVMYLAREMISPEERTVFLQIGHSAPFTLWLDGEKIAERKGCDAWDAENVHLSGIRLHKGVNRILVRLTQVNDDTKFNLNITSGIACAEHYTDFASVHPKFFGNCK